MTDPSGTPHAFDASTISRMAACGVASRNYLAYGKVVAESWLAHHPGSTFTLVIFDGDPTEAVATLRAG